MSITEFLKQNKGVLVNFIKKGKDRYSEGVEDIFQELSMQLYKHYEGLESEDLMKLSYKIISNIKIDNFRKKSKVTLVPLESEDPNLLYSPKSSFESSDFCENILSMEADEVAQSIVRMKAIQGYTFKDLSIKLGMSINTIKSKYYTSLTKLREKINNE